VWREVWKEILLPRLEKKFVGKIEEFNNGTGNDFNKRNAMIKMIHEEIRNYEREEHGLQFSSAFLEEQFSKMASLIYDHLSEQGKMPPELIFPAVE